MTAAGVPHVLVVPGQGQGHVNSCLVLAQALSEVGFSVSVVFLSSFYSKLQSSNRLPNLGPAIYGYVVEDKPDEAQEKLPFYVTQAMKEGLQELVEKLKKEGNPVTCIVSDSFCSWAQDVADKLQLPGIDYWTSTAMSFLMVANLQRLYELGYFPERGPASVWRSRSPLIIDIPGLPSMPTEHFSKEMRFGQANDHFASFFGAMAVHCKRAERVLMHTISELEPVAFGLLRESGIPAFAIGPLHHHTPPPSGNDRQPEREECVAWLDGQAHSSVIYVAFGSYASLSRQDMVELAAGLEASEQPFLWAVRPDAYEGDLSDSLPPGFLTRTRNRGLLTGWAPQTDVLAHPSTGGFFSHCGWNSTLESLWAGVPLVGCPMAAEQRSNAHYISEVWKVGLEVERTEEGGLDRRDVEGAVRVLMQEAEGGRARRKAREVMEMARRACEDGGESKSNLQKFYEDMGGRCGAA